MNNIKLQVWDMAALDHPENVAVRISHDVQNGSAITAYGANLVEALQNLATAIQKTKLADEVWKNSLIIGELQQLTQ